MHWIHPAQHNRIRPTVLARLAAVVGLCLGLTLSASPARAQSLDPTPDAAAQREAAELVNDVYADLLAAKTDDERIAAAQVLILRAEETTNAPAARYVMYDKARELAVEAGDTETAMDALAGIESHFTGDLSGAWTAAVQALARKARTEAQHAAIAHAALDVAERLVVAERYDEATALLARVRSSALRSKRPELISAYRAVPEEIRVIRGEAERIAADLAAIEDAPDDPALNLSVGRFLALYRGEWEVGLPMLAQASDTTLAAAAKADLDGATEPNVQIAIGDQWWALAAGASGVEQQGLADRARQWYRFALPSTQGIERSALLKRLVPSGEVKWGDLTLNPGIATAIEVDGNSSDIKPGQPNPNASWEFAANPHKARRRLTLHFDGYLYSPQTGEVGLRTRARASSIEVQVNGKPMLSGNGNSETRIRLIRGYTAIRGSITVPVAYIDDPELTPAATIFLVDADGKVIDIPDHYWFHDASRQ